MFRDLGYLPAAKRDVVFVVGEISLRFEITFAIDMNMGGAAEGGEHLLVDRGEVLLATVELVGRTPGEELLAYEEQFTARRVLE